MILKNTSGTVLKKDTDYKVERRRKVLGKLPGTL